MTKIFRVCEPKDVTGKWSVQIIDYFVSGFFPESRPILIRHKAVPRTASLDEDNLFTTVDHAIAFLQRSKDKINQPSLRLVYKINGYNSDDYEIMWEWDEPETDEEFAKRINESIQGVVKECREKEADKLKKADRKIFDALRNKHGW